MMNEKKKNEYRILDQPFLPGSTSVSSSLPFNIDEFVKSRIHQVFGV